MKCFNHIKIEAVATCQKCGKGLCRECAEKYTPCMCDTCASRIQREQQQQAQSKEEQRKQKYRDALVDTRGEFITTTIIGVFIGLFFVFVARDPSLTFVDYLGGFFLGICVPFGWKFLTYLQSFFPLTIFGTSWFWLIYGVVKLVLSMIVGIPAFFYQLVKTILVQRKIKNL